MLSSQPCLAGTFQLPMADNCNSDEHQFISGLRNGDEACYELMVRKYAGRMLAVARRYMRNDADASDCVQEAFIQVHRNIDKFEERASLQSWLHRIVINTALMKIRANKRRPEESLYDDQSQFDADGQRRSQEPIATQSLEKLLTKKQTRAQVRSAIEQLPDAARNLLLLRDIEGYTTKEVATLLDTTPGAVKTGLHRARSALKSLLMPIMQEESM